MQYEFGGPLGAVTLTVGLPFFTFFLFASANEGKPCGDIFKLRDDRSVRDGFVLYSVWFAFQLWLDRMLSGRTVISAATGHRLQYRMNGWRAWLCTHLAVALLIAFAEDSYISWLVSAQTLFGVMCAAQIYAIVIAVIAFVHPKAVSASKRKNGKVQSSVIARNGGKPDLLDFANATVYEFWMGASLSPRCGDSFDLKLFCEARPGLQLLVAIDFLLCYDLWNTTGVFDVGMWLCFAMHWWYICDYFWFEDAILSTLDLMHERFGYMLAFGDLVWVPFTYSLQCATLSAAHRRNHSRPSHLQKTDDAFDAEFRTKMGALFCTVLFFVGYAIFRQSNLQKHRFRTGQLPLDERHVICTDAGSQLLCYGWWAVVRKANYTGDWLMSFSQALVAFLCVYNAESDSFLSAKGWAIVFFNPLYFAVLLLHRQMRDDLRCAAKYGKYWDLYCRRVPYRFIPYVY